MNNLENTQCDSCYAFILDEDSFNRSPCEICGSLNRIYHVSIVESIMIEDFLGLKHKSGNPKYPSKQKVRYEMINTVESTQVSDIDRVRKIRVIDRENNRYYEKVWDKDDVNNILREIDQPLTDHKNRGSAKFKKKIIILRGPSGSGKTSTAYKIRDFLINSGLEKISIIEQDFIRRKILKEKDKSFAVNIEMIKEMVKFCWKNDYLVILEGILDSGRYGQMILELKDQSDICKPYYFDIPFEETLKRHEYKSNSNEFGEKEMKQWYKEKDLIEGIGEKLIRKDLPQDDIVKLVANEFL